MIQPTYNYRSLAGDGCCEPENAGLSVFGRVLIGAMNDHRVAVDVAHAGAGASPRPGPQEYQGTNFLRALTAIWGS